MGYLSLIDVQRIVERNFSSLIGWLFAVVSLLLSGVGIYLGRFLRWNSWDVLISPTLVLELFNGSNPSICKRTSAVSGFDIRNNSGPRLH